MWVSNLVRTKPDFAPSLYYTSLPLRGDRVKKTARGFPQVEVDKTAIRFCWRGLRFYPYESLHGEGQV